MRWQLNVVDVGDKTIKAALDKERDHFLLTSPIPTDKLVELNDALRKSYNGPPEITNSLRDMRDREILENPHADTDLLVEQMNGAIAAAVAVLASSPQENQVNVTLSGAFDEQLGSGSPGTKHRDQFGNRITISLDFIK